MNGKVNPYHGPGQPPPGAMGSDCDTLRNIRDASVYIRTFGCTFNQGDSRKLAEILRSQGCTITDSPDHAEIIIINSCTVIESTARKVLRTIQAFRDRRLFVAGCMPAAEPGRIQGICNPGFISPFCIRHLYQENPVTTASTLGIVQVAQGCPGNCSYCITRFARGPLESYPQKEILQDVARQVAGGAVEVQLTAQDVSAWGMDTGESLADLLRGIMAIDGTFRIRIGMANPRTLSRLMPGFPGVFENEKLFRFLHIPVQSGSDRVLEEMNRGYTARDCLDIAGAFRARYPGFTVMTDMIVGFPGETDEDFQQSLEFIRALRPNKVNITRFSRKRGTGVATARDFTDYVKKQRSRAMNAVACEVYRLLNKPWIGKDVPFIVTEILRPGSVIGRSPLYQGIVLPEELPVGSTGTARITGERLYYFTGVRTNPGTR